MDSLFLPSSSRPAQWISRLALAGLYGLGVGHWGYFLNWGNIQFDLHDWTEVGATFSFLRQAVRTGQLPLHIASPLITTDRYLARPDTLFSPQALLLGFFEPGRFMLVNVLVMYSVGFLGLLLIRRRYALSPVAFAAMFLLFNFNGHITAHLAVGHAEWVGYFLLPFFIYLVLNVVNEGRPSWKWTLGVALTLFLIFLQGAFHFFLWSLIFLFALGLLYSKYLLPALKAILFSLLLSLVRILPPAIEYLKGGPAFISGFNSVTDLVSALVVLKHPSEALSGPFNSLAYWEIDTFIGLVGLAFLGYFAVYRVWRRQEPERLLLAPLFVLALFSVGRLYEIISRLPLPLLDSERVPSRFLILPVAFLIVLASIELQRWLAEREAAGWRERLLFLALLAWMGQDLLQHSRIWRLNNMYTLFTRTPVDIRAPVANHPDPPYITALTIGAVLSLLTLLFLVYQASRKELAG